MSEAGVLRLVYGMLLEMVGIHCGTSISRKGVIGRGAETRYSSERRRQGQCRLHRFFLLVVLLLVGKAYDVCWAQSLNDTVAYLDNIEKEVIRVAAKATENFANTCDLVASCGDSCSRQSCEPLAGDLDLLICKNVAKNPTCVDSSGNYGCSQLRVILSKSFVRVSTPPNVTLTTAANYTICSQRMLDPVFLEISNRHNSAINLTSWFYLGSVEGVQRSFPGRDVLWKNCLFDPRKRPWYKAATAVTKDLVILLDGGNSMGDDLPVDIFISKGVTKFDTSINIIKALLDTLTYGDRVSVVLFSSSTEPYLVYNTTTATYNTTFMNPLKDELDKLSVDAKQGSSNFLSGILKVNQTFLPESNSNALKIMVVLTDGHFADDTTLTSTSPYLTQLRSRRVLPLFYSFDRDLSKTVLPQVACNVSGTYERIEKTVLNPLWTLRSYFGIIARWRLQAVNYKPYWSKPYIDSGSSGLVITVAYPVFAPDNYTLIGVVGSDVLLTELGSFATTDFSAALANRPTDDSVSVTPEPLSCNVTLSELNTCPNVVAPANPLCPTNDTSGVSYEERVCNCPPTCKAPKTGDTKSSPSRDVIIGVTIGGILLALVVAALLTLYCCKRRFEDRKIENQVSVVATKSASSEKSLSGKLKGGNGFKRGSSELSTPRPNSAISGSPARQKSSKAAAWPVGNQSLGRDVVCFTMEELEEATNNWSEAALVGKGACGSVYRGELHGVVRAIKKPHPEVDVAKSTFDKELDLLSKLNHRCLVRLIGYCEDEHVLVFEYMQHGTVEDCLHKNRLGRPLSWEERLKIAAGASKGLEYLHEYATTMIIHGDVKPANILLDDKLEAHISDFGLSLSSHDQNAQMLWASRMGGTPGYFDPEYASLGSFTPKSDVYSFGIVLLEILSGRKVVHERRNITSWAAEMYEQDVAAVLDPSLEPPQGVDSFHAIIALALQCVQTEHRYRPKMKDVAAKLSNAAADWHKFEQESSLNDKKHPSRRQHPQYRPLSYPSDEFEVGSYLH